MTFNQNIFINYKLVQNSKHKYNFRFRIQKQKKNYLLKSQIDNNFQIYSFQWAQLVCKNQLFYFIQRNYCESRDYLIFLQFCTC